MPPPKPKRRKAVRRELDGEVHGLPDGATAILMFTWPDNMRGNKKGYRIILEEVV